VRTDLPNQTRTQRADVSAQASDANGTPAEVGVLIVDDQAPFRSVARTVVGLIHGWTVVGEAETGEDGVDRTRQVAPQLVLMDINLPGISGIEATRRIVQAHAGVAVVLVSTYAAEDLPSDATSCGAAGYIRKDDLTPGLLRALLPARG
jgi:two-component system invasion response regulator UvrY